MTISNIVVSTVNIKIWSHPPLQDTRISAARLPRALSISWGNGQTGSKKQFGKSPVSNLAYTSATAGLPHEADLPLTEMLLLHFFSGNAIWCWQLLRKDFERQKYIRIICVCVCISLFPTTPQFCPIFFNSPKLQQFYHFHRKAILTFITLKVHSIVTLGLAYILFLWELKMYQKPTVK